MKQLDWASVSALVRETLVRPREAGTRVLGMDVPDDARWLAFVLVVVLSVILGQASVFLMGDDGFGGSLLMMAIFQSMVMLGLVAGVQGIGRVFGGQGQFPDTLVLVTWLQFVMLVFQVAQILVLVVIPPLFGIITILSLLVFLRSLAAFVMVLHGFTSMLKVTIGIIFSFFIMAFAMAIVLTAMGFNPTGM
ncbi:MAG: YIP1 family protein [Roseinatronobacter sp.]